jgi:hypothetical protein
MNGKGGKYGKGTSSTSGTVTITLSASVAQDLYQALTLALGSGGSKSTLTAKSGKTSGGKTGFGKTRSGKTPPRSGKTSPKGKTPPRGKTSSRKGKTR